MPLNGDIHNQGLDNYEITTIGTISWVNGKIGKALSAGTASQTPNGVSINSNLTDILSEDYSVAVWVKPLGNHVHYNGTILSSGNWNGTKWAFGLSQDNTKVDVLSNGYNIYIDCSVPTNEWTHLCCVRTSDGFISLYKNGVYIDHLHRSDHPLSDANNTTVGRETYANGYFSFNGNINDLRVYDHALSPREVKEISKGLVLHYTLSGSGANLYSGSKTFSGTWGNGSAWTTSPETYQGFTVKQKSSIWGGLAQNVPCTNGDIFTISFYAKVDSGGNIQSVHRSSLGNVTTGLELLGGNFSSGNIWVNNTNNGTSWKRYWATVQITSSDITYLQWRIENSVSGKNMYICGLKLEKGSIATPWTPNLADPEYTKMGFDNGIEYDVSGYENNGTKSGTITYDVDTLRYWTSSKFNGTNSIIKAESLPAETKTISVWVKTIWSSASGYRMIFHDLNTKLAAGFSDTRLLTYVGSENGGAGSQIQTANIYKANEWNHIVIVKTGDTTRDVYINGVLMTTYGANYWGGDLNEFNIGCRHMSGSYSAYFNGLISDLRVYTTALSADDILELYNTPISLTSSGVLMTSGELTGV